MTDNEIIKALESCTSQSGCFNGTKNCPLEHYHYGADCPLRLGLNALDLINRQKAEIETSRTEAIREFAEKFKSTLENLDANSPNKTYQIAMQNMLDYYVPKIIDDIVKEMTEDKMSGYFKCMELSQCPDCDENCLSYGDCYSCDNVFEKCCDKCIYEYRKEEFDNDSKN